MATSNLINIPSVSQTGFRKKYSITLADITKNVAAGSTTTGDVVLEQFPAGTMITSIRWKHNTALASGVGSSTFNCRPFFPAGGTGLGAGVLTLMTTGTTVAVGTTEATSLRTDNGSQAALAAYSPATGFTTPLNLVMTIAVTAGSAVLGDVTAFGVDCWLDYIVLA